MKRRAILQIGTEKTGTTTLQHFLAKNREALAREGFRYPRFCGAINHTGLAALALDPARRDPLFDTFDVRSPADVTSLRERLRKAARDELADDATAIFCSEHCHSRLTTPGEVATLRAFLAEFFDEVDISVYLRRQDEVALSLYSTELKSGGTATKILPDTNAESPYFNYDRFLGLWESEFSASSFCVRLFDRRELTDGSIVNDFVSTWGLGRLEAFTPVVDQNNSIRPRAQEFLRLVNPYLKRIGKLPIEEVRGPLASRLAQFFPGKGVRPSRAAAEAFYAQFRPSNEAVRRRHFPERERLFDDDFDAYPDVEDDRTITLDAFAAIAAELHRAATAETRRLESEIAIRDARLARARNDPRAAEAALRRALAWRPEQAEAHRSLAEILYREDRLDEAIEAARGATEFRPGSYEYWHFLGVILRKAQDFQGAIEAQQRALDINPHHGASEHELAQMLIRLTDAERAERRA